MATTPTAISELTEVQLGAIRSPDFKSYVIASTMDTIRRTSPTSSYQHLIATMAQLRALVGIMDDPKTIAENAKELEALDAERARLENLVK